MISVQKTQSRQLSEGECISIELPGNDIKIRKGYLTGDTDLDPVPDSLSIQNVNYPDAILLLLKYLKGEKAVVPIEMSMDFVYLAYSLRVRSILQSTDTVVMYWLKEMVIRFIEDSDLFVSVLSNKNLVFPEDKDFERRVVRNNDKKEIDFIASDPRFHIKSPQRNSDAKGIRGAILNMDYEIVEELLDDGADPNEPDENGVTPFLMAAQVGDTDTLLCFLQSPLVALNSADSAGYTAVDYAYNGNATDSLKILYDMGIPFKSYPDHLYDHHHDSYTLKWLCTESRLRIPLTDELKAAVQETGDLFLLNLIQS